MNLNVIMTEQEFLKKRQPIFVDPESGIAMIVSNQNLKDRNFAEILSNLKIYWLNTIRGYVWEDHLMLYINDYEIPNFAIGTCVYFFNFFPDIKWIGLGCNKGHVGDLWEPKLKVYKCDICSK